MDEDRDEQQAQAQNQLASIVAELKEEFGWSLQEILEEIEGVF